MKQLLINTIVSQADQLTQMKFIEELENLDLAIDGVEARFELFTTDEVLREDELNKLYQKSINNQWHLFYTIPYDLFDSQGINPHLKRWMSEAHHLGATHLKLNLGDLNGINQADRDKLLEWIDQYHLTITMENGQTNANGSMASIRQALDLIQEYDLPVGFTFDLGNWTVVGENSWQAFEAFKDSITTFHIKNVDDQGQPALIDDGIHNWQAFMNLDIPYIIEYPIHLNELSDEFDKIQMFREA